MVPSSARATRGPLLPIPFRVTKYIDHGVVWHLILEVFFVRQVAYKTCGYKIEPLQQVKKKKMLGCFAPINHSYYIDRPYESYQHSNKRLLGKDE